MNSRTPGFWLGNSGSPRWYAGPEHDFESYLDHLVEWGATSAEIVLHHGPYDERTARVHVIEPEWLETVDAYQRRGLMVQLHVSLDRRFATSRWFTDREGLQAEYEPIIGLAATAAENQPAVSLIMHGASDPDFTVLQNEDATTGFLDWLARRLDPLAARVIGALELGAAKPGRETAAARSRYSVETIVNRVGSPSIGICWDLAHDRENADRELGWGPVPAEEFLMRVNHVHLHDLGDDGRAHYPLLLGTVPYHDQLRALRQIAAGRSVTMEVRWLCATRMGDPWEMLGKSYAAVERVIDEIEAEFR